MDIGARKRIALLIDTATTWGNGLIEGIAEFAHQGADWQLLLAPWGKYDRMMLPDNWDGDGVIARITHQLCRRIKPHRLAVEQSA